MSDDKSFPGLVEECAGRLGLSEEQVKHDYWLVRCLYVMQQMLPSGELPRAYSNGPPVGLLTLGGGTSLSAAWNISHRYSEDIDLILSPHPRMKARHFKSACQRFGLLTAKGMGGRFRPSGKSRRHFFFAVDLPKGAGSVSVDISIRDTTVGPVMRQQEPITPLLARTAQPDRLRRFPEANGEFEFRTLGPCSTTMDKLLAQTALSQTNDLAGIAQRARDIYDLAAIAMQADRFEGHIGRDSRRLLQISQTWRKGVDDSERPAAGFASLATFQKGTPQHAALTAGYEQVLETMVWGKRMPLDKAVRLAVSLDPGPPEGPPGPRPYGWGVARPPVGGYPYG